MSTPGLVSHEFEAMGTEIALVGPERPGLARKFEVAERWLRAYEQRLSRFIPYSELSRLNASAGRPFKATPLLFSFVTRCLELNVRSGGLFDATVLRCLEAAGYDRSFEELAGVTVAVTATPSRERSDDCAARDAHVSAAVRLDPVDRTIALPAGIAIDSGGLGKGWAADRLARYLGSSCLVDAGGDIAAAGMPGGASGWYVGVQNPFEPDRDLALISVADRGVATSSVLRRRWRTASGTAHHLIDPRRGAPADTDAVAVTVVAEGAMMADYHAKVALLQGLEAGLSYLEAEADVEGLIVGSEGRIRASKGFDRYVVRGP